MAASLAVVPDAGAVGELSYDGCLADDASDGCIDLPATPLTGANSVAVGPSGTVYATAFKASSILHFFAAPQGQLSYDGCLADGPFTVDGAVNGCVDLPGAPFGNSTSVAVGPSGTVYATGYFYGSILHFFAAPQGQLSYDGCLDDDGDGCVELPGSPIEAASSVAVGPSGTVYATAENANSILHFFAAPQGQLSYDGCLANDSSDGCIDLPGAPLYRPDSVAVGPSGTVYATGGFANSILHFFAAPEGQLIYDGCLANDGSEGCVDLPGTPLGNPTSVAVSPDGKSVYVASNGADSITTFSTAPQGQISYQGCLSDSGGSCGDLPQTPLEGANSVAVSPDGQSVYVTSSVSESLSFFSRAPSGKLTFEGCLADSGAADCIDLPKAPLNGATSVATSPDGGSVYVASPTANSVAHFFRKAIGSKGGGDKCAGVKITMTGSSKRDVLKGTGRRDVIAGQDGNDVIRGRGGNDLICGGVGKDKLSGGAGKDKLLGEKGKDKLKGGAGKDKLVGGKGKDTCAGGPGNDKAKGCEKGPDR